MSTHSKFSASAVHRWSRCPGSILMSRGKTSPPSIHSAKGTVAHSLLEDYLKNGTDISWRIGYIVEQDGFEIEITEDMVEAVTGSIKNIEQMTTGALARFSETQVDYSHDLAVKPGDGTGTADVIAVVGRTLHVHDYKNGYQFVDAHDNEQLALYAAGALSMVEDVIDEPIEEIVAAIHQPAVSDTPCVWTVPVGVLRGKLKELRNAANKVAFAEQTYANGTMTVEAWEQEFLKPGEKQCQWCPARATCPAARRDVEETLTGATSATPEEFMDATPETETDVAAWVAAHDDPAWLATVLAKADHIEAIINAVRAEADQRLQQGREVPGFKLVQGKRGARAWTDKEAAEKYLRETVRLTIEQAYNLKLISPTQAEKLAKDGGPLGPRQWKKVQELIVQPAGKLHVAPTDDPRPAISVKAAAEEFEPVTDNTADDIG